MPRKKITHKPVRTKKIVKQKPAGIPLKSNQIGGRRPGWWVKPWQVPWRKYYKYGYERGLKRIYAKYGYRRKYARVARERWGAAWNGYEDKKADDKCAEEQEKERIS